MSTAGETYEKEKAVELSSLSLKTSFKNQKSLILLYIPIRPSDTDNKLLGVEGE